MESIAKAFLTPLAADFFARPTLDVARDLVGALLVYEHPEDGRLAGRIVETEAYLQEDPAFRGWGVLDAASGMVQPRGRALPLFGAPGLGYVYLVYQRYWLLNVVTEPEGRAGAVLIRAVEPVAGLAAMYGRRDAARKDTDLASGPGKLTQAFDLAGGFHETMLTSPPLYFAAGEPLPKIATSARIGLNFGVELPYRFFAEGNPHVSPGTPSDVAAARRRAKRNRT